MKLGIVGSEAAKFTTETERLARAEIRRMLLDNADIDTVISGHSPLGGIDLWAIEEAQWCGVCTCEYAPHNFSWGAPGGYRDRNLKIAHASDKVVCVTVRTLPADYHGMRFPHGCYHCATPPEHHIKSGGCWTMRQAAREGKPTQLVIIDA